MSNDILIPDPVHVTWFFSQRVLRIFQRSKVSQWCALTLGTWWVFQSGNQSLLIWKSIWGTCLCLNTLHSVFCFVLSLRTYFSRMLDLLGWSSHFSKYSFKFSIFKNVCSVFWDITSTLSSNLSFPFFFFFHISSHNFSLLEEQFFRASHSSSCLQEW